MTRKFFFAVFKTFSIMLILLTSCLAQESTIGSISSVRISPDMRQIVVRADGVLGRHTAFAFDKPYRLVVDFDSTSLGKISNKIKLEKPPINEIRLGKLENRARLVIDFGDFPVPSYAIERQDNMAVIALGETGIPRTENDNENIQENSRKQQKRSVTNTRPIPLKRDRSKTVESVPAPTPIRNTVQQSPPSAKSEIAQAEHAVKKVLLSNDLLLLEFQDPRNPNLSYSLAIDIDLKNQTLRSASLSSLNGQIKRFEISELAGTRQEADENATVSSGSTVGPRKIGSSGTVFENKPMEKPRNVFNSLPSVTSIQPPEGPVIQNPLKMEEFRLQVKKDR